MRLVGQAHTSGVMGKSTRGSGLTIKCMGKVICGGLMEKNIMEIF